MKVREDFYCVIQPDGAFCPWSVAKSRTLSWHAFIRGLGYLATDLEKRARRQKEGCRCVPVRLTLAEKKKEAR